MDLDIAVVLVKQEALEALDHNKTFNSSHEGLGVIWEEFEELKAEVFKKAGQRERVRLQIEATHLAAMAVRFMVDLT